MTVYRARAEDGVAWITGASSGIGRALALDLAREGFTVAATARDEDELSEVARQAAGLEGRIVPFPCDVVDEPGMERTVAAIEKDAGPIVLAIFNAGVYRRVRGEQPDTEGIVQSFQINLFGAAFGLAPVVERMRTRGYGQIAFMGSASAYVGLPSAGAYGASKAALNYFAQALRFDLERLNIRVQIVNPGFVRTPLTQGSSLPMPGLMSAQEASKRILAGIKSGGFDVSFPRRLVWPVKLLRLLPQALVFTILNKMTGWNKRHSGASGQAKSRRA